ncbi:MAG: succinate dehydrogenase, cytochrome b556 subunit [Alphaproteobacteria bacterium]|nr:succinate dehydrogenase, cytochrome b556 subunit [Alphaproteobacteria bacterium]
MSQSGWTDKRPMSPHVSVWRWHVTMLGSILHRMTGVSNYIGAMLVVGWLFAAASGPETYGRFEAVAGSMPGRIVLFGFTLGVVYHAMSGLRHLVWDTGHGLTPKVASAVGTLIIILAIAATVAIWLVAGLVPGLAIFGGG